MRTVIVVLVGIVLLRIWLLTTPGYAPDLLSYETWSLQAGLHGIQTVYDSRGGSVGYDYPPLYAYILAPIGALYGRFVPEVLNHFDGSRTLGVLVKLPPLAFDFLIAGLVGVIAVGFGLWGRRGRALGFWAACLYLVEPAVLFGSGHWGQPDAIHTFFVLLALTLILVGKPKSGWIAATLACSMKPLALPFLPLLALATYLRGGIHRLVTGAVAGGLTALVVFLPFIVTGRGLAVAKRVVLDTDVMAYTSVNAHNLWWLVGPWRASDAPWLGPISPTALGVALFGIAYLALFVGIWRIERERTASAPKSPGTELAGEGHWFIAAALVALSFFFLSTHMHENHLFAAIPFFVLSANRGRIWLALSLLVGFVSFINMADHDLILGYVLFRADAPSALVLPGTTWHMPRTVHAIATANSIATAAILAASGWAFARIVRAPS